MLNTQEINTSNDPKKIFFENVLEINIQIKGKVTKVLALAPKNCDFISDIFLQNIIDFEKYQKILNSINSLYSNKATKNIFQPALKNQINIDIIKKYKILNRLNHLNQKAKIIEIQEHKLINLIKILIKKSFNLSQLDQKNNSKIESIIIDLSDILKNFQYDIQTINKVINLKQEIEILEKLSEESDIFEKNCYIYKNSS